jgi:hypothetical protein
MLEIETESGKTPRNIGRLRTAMLASINSTYACIKMLKFVFATGIEDIGNIVWCLVRLERRSY